MIAWGRKSGGSEILPAMVLPSLIASPKLLMVANGPGTIAEPPFQMTSLVPTPGLPVPTITPPALTSDALLGLADQLAEILDRQRAVIAKSMPKPLGMSEFSNDDAVVVDREGNSSCTTECAEVDTV